MDSNWSGPQLLGRVSPYVDAVKQERMKTSSKPTIFATIRTTIFATILPTRCGAIYCTISGTICGTTYCTTCGETYCTISGAISSTASCLCWVASQVAETMVRFLIAIWRSGLDPQINRHKHALSHYRQLSSLLSVRFTSRKNLSVGRTLNVYRFQKIPYSFSRFEALPVGQFLHACGFAKSGS